MTILTLSGSSRTGATNQMLLDHLPRLVKQYNFYAFKGIQDLPLFHPDQDKQNPMPPSVELFKTAVIESDAVIISTPAYLHNIPAALKNALEWLTSSGEFVNKQVLAITYTPYAPRGGKAMQSLLWSLTALNARVMGSLELYHTDISFDTEGHVLKRKGEALLIEAVQLFGV